MKGYRVKVVATITIDLCEHEFEEAGLDFNKYQATQIAKARLVEKLESDPNRGHCLVEEIEFED